MIELNGYYTFGFALGYITGVFTYWLTGYMLKYKPDYVIFSVRNHWYIKQLRYGLFYVTLKSEGLKYKYPLCWQTREEAEMYLILIK